MIYILYTLNKKRVLLLAQSFAIAAYYVHCESCSGCVKIVVGLFACAKEDTACQVFFSISIPLTSQTFSRLFRRLCLFPLAEKRENETLSGPASTNLPGVDRKWTNRRGHLAVYLSIASEAGKKRHLHSIVLFLAGASSGKPGAAQLWIDALVPFTPAIAIESKGR